MNMDGLDALIEWKLDGYMARKQRAKEGKVQEQWTIEIRADFQDKDKIPQITEIVCAAARHLVANVVLLGPTCKPECVIFTDNFMSASQKIDIYSDLIGKGQKELAAAGITGAVTTETEADKVSDELLAALKG